MVSSGAFWVANFSYRLAACFTGIGSTCGVEIYWRSFRHFGNYNYSLRKTVSKKMAKMGQKFIKIAGVPPKFEFPPAEPMARKRSTGQKTVRMTRQSVKRVIPKITSPSAP